jgi:hypothetical protein
MRQDIHALLRRIHNAFDTIEGIVLYPAGFAPAGVLVQVNNSQKRLWPSLASLLQIVPSDLVLTCIRRQQLHELWYPSARTFDREAGMMIRVRDGGVLLWGEDLDRDKPRALDLRCILTAQLELFTHYGRNHVVLERLTMEDYLKLGIMLQRRVDQVLAAALISKGVWQFDRQNVRESFSAMFKDVPLLVFLDRLGQFVFRSEDCRQSMGRDEAIELSYLAEQICDRLTLLP